MQDTQKDSVYASFMFSLSLSVAVQVVSVLLLVCREVIVLEQTRNHSMSSSASDDLTSAYTGSDDICSSDYACNSEDIKTTTNPEKQNDPDSAELSGNYGHEFNVPEQVEAATAGTRAWRSRQPQAKPAQQQDAEERRRHHHFYILVRRCIGKTVKACAACDPACDSGSARNAASR